MKRKWILVLGMLALGGAIYVSSRSIAQPPAAPNNVRPQLKVTLLNLAAVSKNYRKCINFQGEMKSEGEVFLKKKKDLEDNLTAWKKEAEKQAMNPVEKEKAIRNMQLIGHQLEDLQTEAKMTYNKKVDEFSVQIYKEVRAACQRYAAANGIDLVLHYTDAEENDPVFFSPANVNRKMSAGACVPLCMSPGVDISADVVNLLHSSMPPAPAAGGAPAR